MALLFLPYHLTLTPGQTWHADLSWHYQNPAAAVEEQDIESATFHVDTLAGDKYTISLTRKPIRSVLAGVSVTLPSDAKEITATSDAWTDRFFILAPWNESPQTKALNRLFDFGAVPPVASYTVALPAPKLPPAVSMIEEDTATATKDHRVWRWTFQELGGAQPMVANGVVWTRRKDGLPIRVHVVAANAPSPEDPTSPPLRLTSFFAQNNPAV